MIEVGTGSRGSAIDAIIVAMRSRGVVRGIAAAILATAGLALAGCATTSSLTGHGSRHGTCAGTQDQDGPAAPAAQVDVVCRWSAALRAGKVDAAARYFRLPSLFENGPIVTVHTHSQAVLVNEGLSCGAEVISAFRQGRYINVLFRLTTRAGPGSGPSGCGSGASARTAFLIRDGHIEVWLRAPSRPGDPGTQTTTTGGSTV